MTKSIRALISGTVQGVWYRDSTVIEANKIGVRGWVRNLRDGRVELLAQGSSQEIQTLLDWAWQGPENANVNDIEVIDIQGDDSLSGFIRRPTA